MKQVISANRLAGVFLHKRVVLPFLSLFLSIFFFNSAVDAQGTWTPLVNPAPDYNHGVMLLLPNGIVMAKTSSGGSDNYGTSWDLLTPDINGSYINGTWSGTAGMHDSRLYFSSQVLKNGNVYIAGGEYGTGRSKGEIYNPVYDEWTPAPHLPLTTDTFSDANSEILDNGKVLQAVVISGTSVSKHTYIYDPTSNTYVAGPPTGGIDNESAWLKLPDNSILYVDILSTNSERYIPATNTWVADAPVPVELYDPYGEETGAAFLLPDGRAFFIGSTSATAYYTPSGNTSPGTWTTGPAIPDTLGAPDAAAAMMVNGKILCAFSHTPILDSVFQRPMSYYLFDYLTNTFTKISTPRDSSTSNAPSYFSNMLCLPDGTVLYASQGDDRYYVYTPDGAPLAAGKPVLDSIIQVNCDTFIAIGTGFNGITEGAAYGDDWQMSSNYPLIRLVTNDTVLYATTYNWNTYGVMRGTQPDTTWFAMPYGSVIEKYTLQVVANGNASDSFLFSGCAALAVKNVTAVNNNIAVYPNPANGLVTVAFNAKNSGAYNVKLFDILGRVVREKNGEAEAGENTCRIPLDGIKQGVYSIVIRNETGVYDTKLVIE